ncbi:transmembrane reductase CYB561D2 isoform X2 [Limanda limanda]|uniref:transmembrane reductase CYB561D2 isoform X2 n=1 Tax=Limanda limanda TaxID=27771 RepID=UPI0029C6AE1B|nr:transmembrane reductase CYB561D2 isoform X2 [Limanda limanda]
MAVNILESESEARIYGFTRRASAVLTHFLCIVFSLFIALMARPGSKAVLIFSPHGSLIKGFSHKIKGRVHWILQCLCVSCAVLGLAAIFYNKHLNSKPHFTSWHGLLGLLTVCVVALQSLVAVPLIYHSLAKGWSLAKLKRYHAASGLITYLLGSMSLLLGLCSAWFTASVKDYTWYLSALCPALCALMIMNQVTSAYMAKKRLKA